LVPHHVRPDPSYRLNPANSRRCRLRGNSETIEGRKGYVLAGSFSAISLCLCVPFSALSARYSALALPTGRSPSASLKRSVCRYARNERLRNDDARHRPGRPKPSGGPEALLKPPMWTCVNFLSESYISRGGGSLAWFRGHGPDYGWRPSTHMRRKPLIPGGDPPGVRIPAAAPPLRPH